MLLTALDFETTGKCPGYPDEPWQIGIAEVSIECGDASTVSVSNVTGSLLRVSPGRPFNKFAPGRHAQLRDKISSASCFQENWVLWRTKLLNRPIIAHNASTERKMLRQLAPLHAFGPWIDTLSLSRIVWRGLPSYTLENLISVLGLAPLVSDLCPGLAPHDASYDAAACAVLFAHIIRQPGWNKLGIERLSKLS